MIHISNGLKNSLVVLELMRGMDCLSDVDVHVGTFTNCRENGLTFMVFSGRDCFTWCVYEDRSSDSIIVNGKPGFISLNGDLPYANDSSSGLASFEYNEHMKCAEFLAKEIKEFHNKNTAEEVKK